MPASLQQSGNQNPVIFGAGNTRYAICGIARLAQLAVEADAQRTVRTPGVYSKLSLRVVTNNTTGSSTVKFRKNGADGNQTITIGAGVTGEFIDASNTDSAADGDEICYQVINGGGGGLFITFIQTVFVPTADETVSHWSGSGTLNSPAASTTYFHPPFGNDFNLVTTETIRQVKVPCAGVLRNLFVNTNSNGRSTDTVVTVRKNGVDTTLTATIAGGALGFTEDTAHQVSVAADDLIVLGWATGTGAGDIGSSVGLEFVTANGMCVLGTGSGGAAGASFAFGLTRFFTLAAQMATGATAEADARSELRQVFVAEFLRAYIVSNTLDASTAITLRRNGADAAPALSVGSGVTGWVEDNVNFVACDATDELNFGLVAGGSSGAIALSMIAIGLSVRTMARLRHGLLDGGKLSGRLIR
jgi:hypothetical protein